MNNQTARPHSIGLLITRKTGRVCTITIFRARDDRDVGAVVRVDKMEFKNKLLGKGNLTPLGHPREKTPPPTPNLVDTLAEP